jgi:hypothetical protein
MAEKALAMRICTSGSAISRCAGFGRANVGDGSQIGLSGSQADLMPHQPGDAGSPQGHAAALIHARTGDAHAVPED